MFGEVSDAGFVSADFVASEADLALSTALDILRVEGRGRGGGLRWDEGSWCDGD